MSVDDNVDTRPDNRRKHPRIPAARAARLVVAGVGCDVDVKDVSAGGCFVDVDAALDLGAAVTVSVDGVDLAGRVVRVRRGGKDRGVAVVRGVAVEFVDVDECAIAALLRAVASPG